MSTQESFQQIETNENRFSTFLADNWQKIIAAVLWTSIIGAYVWYTRANDLTVEQSVQALADWLQSPIGPLIFILIYAVRPLLFFSATVITIAGGSIFGPVYGIIYTVIASNISAMIAYTVGRYFGEGILDDSDDAAGLVQKYAARMRKDSFETVLIMRLIFLPYDLVNYLSGFLKINWRAFLFATILGSIPGTIAFVLFGASIDIREGLSSPQFNPWSTVASVAIVVVSIVISRYLKKREGDDDVEAEA